MKKNWKKWALVLLIAALVIAVFQQSVALSHANARCKSIDINCRTNFEEACKRIFNDISNGEENYDTYEAYLDFCSSMRYVTSYADDDELFEIIDLLYQWSVLETLFEKLDKETCLELYHLSWGMDSHDKDLKHRVHEKLVSLS